MCLYFIINLIIYSLYVSTFNWLNYIILINKIKIGNIGKYLGINYDNIGFVVLY